MVIVNKRHALHKPEFHLVANLVSGQLVDYIRNWRVEPLPYTASVHSAFLYEHWPLRHTPILLLFAIFLHLFTSLQLLAISVWSSHVFSICSYFWDRLCGLVVRVLGYRSGGPGSIPGTTRKKAVGLERGQLSLVSTTEEQLDRKVAAPV
jgi:hypothetical protein